MTYAMVDLFDSMSRHCFSQSYVKSNGAWKFQSYMEVPPTLNKASH